MKNLCYKLRYLLAAFFFLLLSSKVYANDTDVIVKARGTKANGVFAHFKLLVNNFECGDHHASMTCKEYSFSVPFTKAEIEEVKNSIGLRLNAHAKRNDVIHYSSIPWTHFTGLTHPRKYGDGESVPKISFGKMFVKEDKWFMPVAVYVHHGLADGYHVSKYFEVYQKLMNEN